MTNGFNTAHLGQRFNNHLSPNHITFRAKKGNFCIGSWTGEKHCPGIPLDPQVLEERETVRVDWVELEFQEVFQEVNSKFHNRPEQPLRFGTDSENTIINDNFLFSDLSISNTVESPFPSVSLMI